MGMYLTLNLPDLPRWATNTGRRVEPGETDKDVGNVVGTRPVARWDNWGKGSNYDWVKKQIVHSLTEHYTFEPINPAVQGLTNCIYHPAHGYWIATNKSDIMEVSRNGRNFDTGAQLDAGTNTPYNRSCAIDSQYYIFGAENSGAERLCYGNSVNPAALYAPVTMTAFTGNPGLIVTDYPTSDAIIATDIDGIIMRATAVTGTFAVPATPPSYIDSTTYRRAAGLFRVDTNEYVLITRSGECFGTTDSGVTWSTRTRVTGASSTYQIHDASFSEDTGRIVAVGDANAAGKAIYISDDGGATWSQPSVDPGDGAYDINYYFGYGIWLAIGEAAPFTCTYSVDDGDTWVPFSIWQYENQYAPGMLFCDGARAMLASNSNMYFGATEYECFLLGATVGEQW